jgi:DNA-binding XRE family transcriptional regulator
MEKMKINRIKEVMTRENISSKIIANAIGKDKSTFSGYYNNVRQPNMLIAFQIAATIGVPVCELFMKVNPYAQQSKKNENETPQ